MKNSFQSALKKLCTITDLLAGFCFFAVMVVVVANAVLRNIFPKAILGTVDFVGMATATGLGLALSHCEFTGGNIAISIITDKLSNRVQSVISVLMHIISTSFYTVVAWRMFMHASSAYSRGLVTPTATIPVFPFIFLLAINLALLNIVIVSKLIDSIVFMVAVFKNGDVELTHADETSFISDDEIAEKMAAATESTERKAD